MSSTEWSNERNDYYATERGWRPVIVLAEDNEDARRVYGLILRHSGYRVEEATDGLSAVQLVREVQPSLVLMDIGLPGVDGFQASRMLKADPDTTNIPLIAFSARIDSTADLMSGAPTFDGYILKPVSPRELVRRVDAYLSLLGEQRPRSPQPDVWSDDRPRDPREESITA